MHGAGAQRDVVIVEVLELDRNDIGGILGSEERPHVLGKRPGAVQSGLLIRRSLFSSQKERAAGQKQRLDEDRRPKVRSCQLQHKAHEEPAVEADDIDKVMPDGFSVQDDQRQAVQRVKGDYEDINDVEAPPVVQARLVVVENIAAEPREEERCREYHLRRRQKEESCSRESVPSSCQLQNVHGQHEFHGNIGKMGHRRHQLREKSLRIAGIADDAC